MMSLRELSELLAAGNAPIHESFFKSEANKILCQFSPIQKIVISGAFEHGKSAKYIYDNFATQFNYSDHQAVAAACRSVIDKVNMYCQVNDISEVFDNVVDGKRRRSRLFEICRVIDPSIKPTRLKVTIALEEIEQ